MNQAMLLREVKAEVILNSVHLLQNLQLKWMQPEDHRISCLLLEFQSHKKLRSNFLRHRLATF